MSPPRKCCCMIRGKLVSYLEPLAKSFKCLLTFDMQVTAGQGVVVVSAHGDQREQQGWP